MAPINPREWDTDIEYKDRIWDTGIDNDRHYLNQMAGHKHNAARPGEFMHSRAVSGEFHSNAAEHHASRIRSRLETKIKKHKMYFRRFIVASKGIGIGGLIFWAFIGYQIFGGDDDADKPEGTAEKKDFQTKVVETAKKLKTEVEVRVAKAKDDYNKDQDAVPMHNGLSDAEEVDKKVDDPDDIYGNTEDKY